jgi:hypothetical protein
MRVQTGTYTGTAASHRVPLVFKPDLVVVIPEAAARPLWRNNTTWHGKSQWFDSTGSASNRNSAYAIGPLVGNLWEPLNGRGCRVQGA